MEGEGPGPRGGGWVNLSIDTGSSVAPFEQLRSQIAAQVASGDLPAGTRLATVRQMAVDLGLAAGTVARAYRELEADGVIATHGRRGTFVSSSKAATAAPVEAQAASYVATARRAGLTVAEAIRLVERLWAP
jgi:DNA-binding transcriptional regulator YhcF (GntR family)